MLWKNTNGKVFPYGKDLLRGVISDIPGKVGKSQLDKVESGKEKD